MHPTNVTVARGKQRPYLQNTRSRAVAPALLALALIPLTLTGSPARAAAPAASRLSYDYHAANDRRYKVTGLFTGHFPPFAQADGPPINLKAAIEYTFHINKQDPTGTEVAFTVISGDISLLEKEPGPDGKVDPSTEVSLALPLSDIKKSLDVTAVLRPDGSVASIKNGADVPAKINFGIDPRKLFLLVMPVIFPDRTVGVNDEWTFNDGILGHNPGKITYKARISSIAPQAKALTYQLAETIDSQVNDSLDKDGNSTDKTDDAVGSLTGTVTASGEITLVAPVAQDGARLAGHVTTGQFLVKVALTDVRPDPDQPGVQQKNNIDVKARLVVEAEKQIKKPAKTQSASRENGKVALP